MRRIVIRTKTKNGARALAQNQADRKKLPKNQQLMYRSMYREEFDGDSLVIAPRRAFAKSLSALDFDVLVSLIHNAMVENGAVKEVDYNVKIEEGGSIK